MYGSKFNYERLGISIRKEGSCFLKEKRGWTGHDEKSRNRLCVENPQDPTVDIGRPAFAIMKVKRAFQHAYDTLIYNNRGSQSLLYLIIQENPRELKN
jgi:DNA polymerase sigma